MVKNISSLFFALALAATLFAWAGVQPVRAASFIVTDSSDAIDTNLGDGVCQTASLTCTLRAAIMEANALSGDDTISLPATTFNLSVTGAEDAAASGDLDITSNITINGASASSTIIDGSGISERVFHVLSGNVTIANVTIRDGNAGSDNGGGIYMAGGTLNLNYSRIVSNQASSGAGIAVTGGTLTINFSSIGRDFGPNANTAASNGGGLFMGGGASATINNSTLANNTASAGGGAFISSGSSATFNNSTVSSNSSTGTSVTDGGGGLYAAGSVTLNSSTVASNSADVNRAGGGILQLGGTVTLRNTIVADNGPLPVSSPDCSGTMTSLGYNLLENSGGCSGIVHNVNGDIVYASITPAPAVPFQLGALADYGGQTDAHTHTHSIELGSGVTTNAIAVDRANPAGCTNGSSTFSNDQRGPGYLRNENFRCDIGAFEFIYVAGVQSPTVTPTITFTPSNTPTFTSTFTATITSSPAPTSTLTATSTATPVASVTATRTASATPAPKFPLFTSPPQVAATIDFTATAQANAQATSDVATALAAFPSFTPDFGQTQTAAALANASPTPTQTSGPTSTTVPAFAFPAETGVLSMSQSLGRAGGRFQCGIWVVEAAPGTVQEGSSINCNTVSEDDTIRPLPDGLQGFWQLVDIHVTTSNGEVVTSFAQPVRTCAYYKPEYLTAAGDDPINFTIYTSSTGKDWQPLPTTPDTGVDRVCALTDHFSYFRLAAEPLPAGGIVGTVTSYVQNGLVGVVLVACGLLLLVVVIIVVIAIARRKPKLDAPPPV